MEEGGEDKEKVEEKDVSDKSKKDNKKEDTKEKKDEIVLDKKKEKIIYITVAVIIVLIIVAFILSIPKPYDESRLENNTVVRVIDGDTFEYYDGSSESIQKVRLLCVDTPERGKKGYNEAKDYLRSLIMYKEVTLKSSVTDKDKYGRLLRYVYVNEDGEILFINKMILNESYGVLMIIPPEDCKLVK